MQFLVVECSVTPYQNNQKGARVIQNSKERYATQTGLHKECFLFPGRESGIYGKNRELHKHHQQLNSRVG